MSKCLRCGQEFEPPASGDSEICGSCADELRAEQDAYAAQAEAEAEAEALAQWEVEEAERIARDRY